MKLGLASVAAGAFSGLALPDRAEALSAGSVYIGSSNYAYINTDPDIADDLGIETSNVYYKVAVWNPTWSSNYVRSQLSGWTSGGDDGFISNWHDHNYARATAPQSDLTGFDDSTDMNVRVHGWDHTAGHYNEYLHYEEDQATQFHDRYLSDLVRRPDLPNYNEFTYHRNLPRVDRPYDNVVQDERLFDTIAPTFQMRHFNFVGGTAVGLGYPEITFICLDVWVNDELGWRRFLRRHVGQVPGTTHELISDWATAQFDAENALHGLPWMSSKVRNLFRALQCSCIDISSAAKVRELDLPLRREIMAGNDATAALITGHQNFGLHRVHRNAALNINGVIGEADGYALSPAGAHADDWRNTRLDQIPVLEFTAATVLNTTHAQTPLANNTDGDPHDLPGEKSNEAPTGAPIW